jgi:hypothetical protein
MESAAQIDDVIPELACVRYRSSSKAGLHPPTAQVCAALRWSWDSLDIDLSAPFHEQKAISLAEAAHLGYGVRLATHSC